VLQKMSDPVLTTCPACGTDQFQKQVTAAGFQLKGSGWYATDFKGGSAPAAAVAPAATGEAGGAATPAAAPASAPAAPSSDSGSAAAASSSGSHGGGSCACH
jgi:predicted nucleic acid-binding Zn ribbon protein